jgi:hypothetical protein
VPEPKLLVRVKSVLSGAWLEGEYLRSEPRPEALSTGNPLRWVLKMPGGYEMKVDPDWWEECGGSMRTVGLHSARS